MNYLDNKYMRHRNHKSYLDRAITRAVWGFIAYIPFCYFWGVDNFTLFSFLGTLYFVPVHWIYDKVMKHG